MILVCALAALTTVLALAAHRRAWAAALGMVSGAAVVLAALVLDVSTRTMLLCLLIPCAAAMWPIEGALMNFTAPAFVLLFPIVLALHWMLPPSRRWVLLLAASLGFYAVGSPQALPLLAGITLGTYAALGIAKSKTQTAKKLWLTCAAVLCIGCLCLFKYAGIFRTDVPLLLPAGISFYTFQTLSYVIDIYRGRLMPERHPGYYALFVSFFPQLVAGPIERSTALLPQLHAQERRMDSSGWLWMVRGFAKKLLLADTAAVFVDSVYASPADASGPAVLLATLLFAGQIYWDFSGYSDIAVGAAALLGVRLSRNFDHPYRADSLRDFWRRWHISLTRWFTDYVYIPLGGSRRGTARLVVNTMVVFLLSGLWHGAALHFVVWGGVHGALLLLEKALTPCGGKHKARTRTAVCLRHAYTFSLVCIAWVFFRAASVSDALLLLSRLPVDWSLSTLHTTLLNIGIQPVAELVLGALCLHLLPETSSAAPSPRTVLAFCLLALTVVAAWFSTLHTGTTNAFIYFNSDLAMKKLFTSMLCVFIAIPLLLTVWGFALPAQYGNTFVGELPAKRALLAAESDKPRLILVGGSAAAFGVDSALLARELPDYQPVNFGLYAALGTRVMLDLSIKELRPGDLVVIMPEQQRQALSDTVGADTFWQAVDGDFSALACLHTRDFGPLLGAFPRFAGAKFRYFLTGAPTPDGVYRRGSFNAVGDVVNPLCSANILPDGYDTTMPIRFDPSMLDTDFCDALNAYTAQAESVGAVVLYHFPPMNVLAVSNAEDIDAYADYLQSQLTAPLAGDPHTCVMDAGWFYDTNFHLNVSGKTVFTRQLIRDLKAVLGDTSSTEIALPAMPARRIQTDTEAANNSDAAYFTWESDRLVVNAAGRGHRTLTVPGEVDGRPVTALTSDTFAGCSTLEKLTIQQNITALPDGLFAKCSALQEITLTQPDPARLSVGQALLDGAPAFCRIRVPAASYTSYCLNYAWSPYAETFAH